MHDTPASTVQHTPTRVRSYQCPTCAARIARIFSRCPSCGVFTSAPIPIAFKAPARKRPENPWSARGGDDDGVGGFGGGLEGYRGGGDGFGETNDAPDHESGSEENENGPDADEDEISGDVLPVIAHELDDVEPSDDERLPSGHPIWDEMTCGGPVVATASGLTAFPGVGKSTLMLEVAYAYRSLGKKVVILALEEPSSKVSRRAVRLGLSQKYPRKYSKKTGKALGYLRIISPLDEVEGESDEEREARLEQGYSLERLLEVVEPKIDVLILDSASMCFDPEVGGVRGGTRQLKHTGRIFYERCQGAGRFSHTTSCVGISILQATKTGDSAVPQAFVHYIDATYIGEHVEHDGNVVIACRDQKSPTGYIWFRSHGKNRDGANTAVAYAKMTATGLDPCEHDDVPPRGNHDEEVKAPEEEVTMQGLRKRKRQR